ncbi:MAG TPA: HAD family hydrolase [Anditalea sp.]|nr:HAD family hydrolase [Anditalea sp.]
MDKRIKKALIYDMDNTLFPVSDIGPELFRPLFDRIEASGSYSAQMDNIKKDLMRKPFQEVAKTYDFDNQLIHDGDKILSELTYEKEIKLFEDYPAILELPGERFLVTTGYKKMQQSKINSMGVSKDFKDIIVVDPSISNLTKKDVFAQIMSINGFLPNDMLVIGDDPDSEIKAAKELGIETVLYNKLELTDQPYADFIIKDFRELAPILLRQTP